MLRSYADIILYFLRQIPAALGEFAPLFMGGAFLSLAYWFVRRMVRRGF